MGTHLDVPRNLRKLGLPVLLLHPPGPDAETIAMQVGRLDARCDRSWPLPETLPPGELAIVFAENGLVDRIAETLHDFAGAVVASIDPRDGRIVDRMLASGVHALLFRPLRLDTVVPQLALARQIRTRQLDGERKQAHVEDMLRTRRTLEKAVLVIGERLGLGADDAYGHLRTLAMRSRRPIAAVAGAVLAGAPFDPSEADRDRSLPVRSIGD